MRTSLRRIPVDEKKAHHYSGVKWNLGLSYPGVPAGSPSRGGHVTVYVKDVNLPSLPTPFYFVPVSISVLWPFQLYFIPYILQTTLRFLTLFFRSYLCRISPFNFLSLYEGLLQP